MTVYNKIFTKILDSSIWLEPDATRLVWLTLIAAMDEDGFCQFASVANLAHRARVSLAGTEEAVQILTAPDVNSSDPENEGRRIERVPGGWLVLNSAKYRMIVTRANSQEKTRQRVAKFRAKRNGFVTPVTQEVTPCTEVKRSANADVTTSVSVSETINTAREDISPDMVGFGVMETLGLAGRELRHVLESVCRAEIKSGRDPKELSNALIQAWRDNEPKREKQGEFAKSAAKFFGEGLWKLRPKIPKGTGTPKTALELYEEQLR